MTRRRVSTTDLDDQNDYPDDALAPAFVTSILGLGSFRFEGFRRP